jgi:hypothetical protein
MGTGIDSCHSLHLQINLARGNRFKGSKVESGLFFTSLRIELITTLKVIVSLSTQPCDRYPRITSLGLCDSQKNKVITSDVPPIPFQTQKGRLTRINCHLCTTNTNLKQYLRDPFFKKHPIFN